MKHDKLYYWEIELDNGKIITKNNKFDYDRVVRLSYIPKLKLFPRHDLVFQDFKLVKRFARGFLDDNSKLLEYLHCAVTDKFRLYLKSSTGQCIVTPKDYELYI